MKNWSWAFGIAACLVLAFVTIDSIRETAKLNVLMGDFRAFYCAGSAVIARRSPYDEETIRSCESRPYPRTGIYTTRAGEVLPAPVPGYAAALVAPLALLPLPAAAVIFFILSAGASLLACALFARSGIAPFALLVIALAIMLGSANFRVGELPPFALLGFALLVTGLHANRTWLVAAGIALVMVEPQVGTAVVLTLVIARRFALTAIATCAVLALVSVLAIGFGQNIYYVQTVLPQHVAAELPAAFQYTSAWGLKMFGASDARALIVSRALYAIALAGVALLALAPFARRQTELAILCAPAVTMAWSPFLHLDHMMLAIPAALAIARTHARDAWLGIFAACALAVPVFILCANPDLIPVGIIAIVAIVTTSVSLRVGLWTTAAALGYIVVCIVLILKTKLRLVTATAGVSPATTNATSYMWALFVRHHSAATAWPLWPIKLPAWLALIAISVWYVRRSRASLAAVVRT